MNGKGKWLKLVLAASLALNVAFFAPYIYRYIYPAAKEGEKISEKKIDKKTGKRHNPFGRFEKNLKLGEEQRKQLEPITKQFRLELMKYKREILAKRIEIIDELGDPEYTPETISTLTTELNELENKLNLLFVDTLMRIDTLLEPEQRLEFLVPVEQNLVFHQQT